MSDLLKDQKINKTIEINEWSIFFWVHQFWNEKFISEFLIEEITKAYWKPVIYNASTWATQTKKFLPKKFFCPKKNILYLHKDNQFFKEKRFSIRPKISLFHKKKKILILVQRNNFLNKKIVILAWKNQLFHLKKTFLIITQKITNFRNKKIIMLVRKTFFFSF